MKWLSAAYRLLGSNIVLWYGGILGKYGGILGKCGGIMGKYSGILGKCGGILSKYGGILGKYGHTYRKHTNAWIYLGAKILPRGQNSENVHTIAAIGILMGLTPFKVVVSFGPKSVKEAKKTSFFLFIHLQLVFRWRKKSQ